MEINCRTKVAIWGITTPIWNVINNTIDPFATEIVTFIDSDEYKQGLVFHGIPIISIEEFDASAVDYILITAYSGFQDIVRILKSRGVADEKIQIFLSQGLCNYVVGDISKIDWRQTLGLYTVPGRVAKAAEDYVELYAEYSRIEKKTASEHDWFYGKRLISHALGGFVNGVPMMYTNSKEAFAGAIEHGFSLAECDMIHMPNGEWYGGHRYSDIFDAGEKKYNLISLSDIILTLAKNPGLTCLFDIKWDVTEDYREFVMCMNTVVEKFDNEQELRKQIVLEVYDEDTIKCAYRSGYQMIFTQYRNPERDCYMKSAILCDKYGISVLADGTQVVLKGGRKKTNIWTDKGLNFYVFSTDSPEEISEIRNMGGYGVFTNFLYQSVN